MRASSRSVFVPLFGFLCIASAFTSSARAQPAAAIEHAQAPFDISNQGQVKTIAVIDAYDHPNIEADLGGFSRPSGLVLCTTGVGCFKKVYA